ncbi:uncharacterized protein C8Q71DRAFT_733480 [Rhodofomes roseus]|uniref:F-box domain-containing protein n=1 Tax=Rhodofomes roseus TaxID=34475 RepID=A0ABQ8KWA0_9APHY|nr:uncharacterized protein C8Q71DRAFT_733480 [Rhodofomes roseus]KAH9842575.1 hypothetical protein C8Q71DRAFT_733480 [Rhodofomes roseus]
MHPAMDDALRQVQEYVLRANAFMKKLRTLRNSSVHINRVPTELLAEIFWHATPPSSDRCRDISRLNCVTHVCRHWRTVALDAARLWRTLQINRPSDFDAYDDEPPSRIEEYLRRSKSYPLDVTIMCLRGTRVDDCIEILQSHQHRVRTLHIEAQDPYHDIIRTFLPRVSRMAAPLLEEIRLEVDPTLQPHGLFGGHTPSLHSIHLSHVSLPLIAESIILRNLQHLILLGQVIPITEMDTLFDILEHCPDLKTLKLHSHPALPRLPAPQPRAPARTDRDVLLPSLQVVDIDWQQSRVTGCLLTHLCLPETANLKVHLARLEYLPHRAAIRTLSSMRTLWIANSGTIVITGYTHSVEDLFDLCKQIGTSPCSAPLTHWLSSPETFT